MGERADDVHLGTCAEEILWLLAAHGVDLLFLNPGTDSAPLQEAAATLAERGLATPRIVPCSFEAVALAAAHGYFQVTRRPQAVFVHVDVGTQNLGAMVHDVLRDRAGAVVIAGKTPYGEAAEDVGGRSNPINWPQDVPDQAGIVRSYAKWIAELTRAEDTARVVGRAVQVAAGGTPGLSYLTVSRDILMEPAEPASRRRVTAWATPSPAGLAPEAEERIAALLAGAERPVLVTSRVGRTPGAAEAVARLAEVAAMPVIGRPEAVNLVTDHPMARRDPKEAANLLAAADVVVLVEVDVPWIPRANSPAPDASIVHIDPDPVKADMPLWTFPVDVSATADGATALGQLARRADVAASGKRRRAALDPAAGAAPSATGALDPDAVIRALNEVLEPGDLVVEEAVSNAGAVARLLERTEPETLFSAGGPGLGWAPGASVGIKLARPDRRVVTVIGDGAWMFGVPTAALCLAAEAGAPFVAVILDNDGYRASRLPVLDLFPDGTSAAAGRVVGTRFASPPDFVGVARACGAWAERVEDLGSLVGTLRAALAAADAGTCAVVDVRVAQD